MLFIFRIRAIYGLDIMRNGLHASSSNKHAREEIRLLFPDYEFIKTKPMPFHGNHQSSSSLFNKNFYDRLVQLKELLRKRFQHG